ncbi:hypothetical protein CKA32_006431 [Geitlerinema sp. FC II]|nr:hypothetical protein CKA32_006431 [Geitlerinema sp. FC II]
MSKSSNDGKYPIRTSFRATSETIARLDAYARSQGMNRSEAIRRWADSLLTPNKDETSAA